jgi:hypothetical protein
VLTVSVVKADTEGLAIAIHTHLVEVSEAGARHVAP